VLCANQPGILYPTFANNAGVNGEVLAVARQRDGKVLLVALSRHAAVKVGTALLG
jgi:hypothetical protein